MSSISELLYISWYYLILCKNKGIFQNDMCKSCTHPYKEYLYRTFDVSVNYTGWSKITERSFTNNILNIK